MFTSNCFYNSKNRVQQTYEAELSHMLTDYMSYTVIIVSYPSDGIFLIFKVETEFSLTEISRLLLG